MLEVVACALGSSWRAELVLQSSREMLGLNTGLMNGFYEWVTVWTQATGDVNNDMLHIVNVEAL